MNELQVFKNGEFGELEIMEINGKIFFPATLCAKMLGYAEPQKAVRMHCKGVSKMDTPTMGGMQQVNYIPEGDLYRLIIRSKLPAAERFERWIFDDVLVSIRQKGSYSLTSQAASPELVATVVVEVVKQLAPILAEVVRDAVKTTRTAMEPPAPALPVAQPAPNPFDYDPPARKRSPGIIDCLPIEIRQEVEEMICSKQYTYKEIVQFLGQLGVKLSAMCIHRYKKSMGV